MTKKLTYPEVEKICRLYEESKKTSKEIAKQLKKSHNLVQKILKEYKKKHKFNRRYLKPELISQEEIYTSIRSGKTITELAKDFGLKTRYKINRVLYSKKQPKTKAEITRRVEQFAIDYITKEKNSEKNSEKNFDKNATSIYYKPNSI